ncbi:uncharacterized protein LOC124438520 [Xenia sp. Carnegie-2017]|uniref:uncharacterized protein LOC124438520 n=1 Tax=Xenia sp. Carnegie-2017 TaxID=2897299 RepID=UPI001F0336DC|nr:uncharacterized protein LOC124438520 [Xenia sp. Carnegie-2017]
MGILEEGNCSMNNGDCKTAIEHYNNCVEVADEDSLKTIAYFGLGNAYTLSNNWEEGLNSFKHCLKFSSKVETEYFEQQVYLGLGSVHSTIKRLEDAMKKNEMECLCHIALGGLNKLLGNYEKSLEHYRKGFSFIDCEHQEEEIQPQQQKENQQGNQQEQNKRRERPRRPRKVGGINVGKDYLKNLKNLSIVTSAGIVRGVLAVLWELAELFDKLEQYREAADIYEIYLKIVTEDKDIEKHENAMEYLIQIYEEEGRDLHRDSMKTRLQEFRERKKNQVSELHLQEWKYNDPSIKHHELFLKMIEYRRNPNVKVELLNDVRVIFSDEFCIGKGSDGTRVYLGLSKDGYGKAVKRILQYNFIDFAKKEMKIFNKIKKKKSNYLVNYSYFKKDTETEWVYLILDLCEESLEDFVHSSTLENLQNSLPKILRHILLGLVDLHREPSSILHRNLKPSNVLCNAKGKFLIADFGLSRIMENGLTTHASNGDRGTPHWIAPESYCKDNESFDKSSYKRESDVMNAGLVAYYVATKGKHPFGSEECRLLNLLRGNPIGLKEIKDVQLKHLLSWMLQLNPKLRPSANEALKHPYLLSDEEKFDMLCDLDNQPVKNIYRLLHPPNSDVHKQLNRQRSWKDCIDPEVFKLFNKRHYDSTWFGCVEFLLNFHQHWHDKPPTQLLQSNGNYKKYFLQVFPELPLLVHNIMKLIEGKSIPDLEEHLTNMQLQELKHPDESAKHKEILLKLIECGRHRDNKVEYVYNVRVIFSDEFCIGKGSDGTRVYVGLAKDGCKKAVKRIRRDCIKIGENGKKILNEGNAKNSQYAVNYFYYEENLKTEYVYLILDLCEESLKEYVESDSNSLDCLQKSLPDILKHILKGLVDLHSEPNPILHRDLKPSNVLRDAQGQYLIADFGISGILKNGLKTHVSDATKGTHDWIAPESYVVNEESVDRTRYKPESDVMNAGMVAYYVATKGKHPFGPLEYRLKNLLDGNSVGLEEIKDDQLIDLLLWMLQRQPEDRPSAKEALKHPYLQSAEENFNMLCNGVNQLEIEICDPLNSHVHKQLNDPKNWMDRIDGEVFNNFNDFDPTWLGCLKFLQNVCEHWQDKPRPQLPPSECNYKKYFLKVFPELPLLVHRIIRYIKRKSTPGLKEQFAKLQLKEWKYFDQSIKHKEMFIKLIKYGCDPGIKVECVNDVRVIFSHEFCIGRGNNETRVYLGLKKDGYGKAVKRVCRDNLSKELENETKILNEIKAKKSSYVVNYYHLEVDTGTEHVYLILDLCEESLESFVKSSTLEDLQKSLPEILKQILKGLADLHSEPNPILHRDLKPSNVLRDAQGQYLIADFGISRILKNGLKTHVSDATKGTHDWIAPESYVVNEESVDKARYKPRYKPESDVMNAGMVAYYVATKGKHPFGPLEYRLKNLGDGNPVGLMEINDVVLKDLLSWMLQRQPEDRPSAKEALKHPYLQSAEENFDMLCDVVNQLEIEICDPLNSGVHKQLNDPENWMDRIDGEIFNNFNDFDSTWLGCLKFLQNVREHWQDEPHPQLPPSEGNYKKYFLQVLPELPLLVHKIIRYIEGKSTPGLEEQFATSEEKKSLLYLLNDNGRDVDIGITSSTSGPFSYEKMSVPSPMSDNDYDDIDKTPSTAVLDNNSEVIIGVSPSTSKPDLLSQPWKCYDKSIMHQQKFRMMEEYGQENPRKVKLVNGVKFICSEEFLLGKGSDGTRVYLGLGKDGYGKAVKRLLRDNCAKLAKREKDILNEFNAKRSNYIVNYWYLEEEPGTDYLYLILDLCEESLESFVQSSTLQDLQKELPTILTHILKGLADLHSDPCPILHRDLTPSNVLRDVQGNFLIADFGISHMLLSDETSTHWSIQRGAKYWITPESYNASDDTINKVRYKKESDIMNAGMVAYYVATKGKHPFGAERHLLYNLLNGNPVGLDEIKDATLKDLLSWMLQLEPEDRPLAKKALKHPYLQTDEENFDFLCDVGNEPEIKKSSPHSLPSNLREQLNLSIDWMDRIDPDFFNHFNKVSDSTWLGCLRFLRNVRQHWHHESRPQLSSCVKDGNYQEYFLRLFKELPLLVHRTIRLSEWKTRPVLKKRFPNSEDPVKLEEGKGKTSEAVIDYPDLNDFDGAPAIIVMGGVYSKHIREHISYEYLEKLKESAREGYAVLTNGGTAVDAVEKAVSILESSDLFMIGRGSPLNSEGEVECDALIMDGHTLKTGAVISGRNFKNPVCLARKIMKKTPHSALSGDGALKFAQDNGLDWCEPNELLNGQRRVPPKYFNDFVRYFMEEGSFPADAPEIRPEEVDTCDCACAVAIDRDGKMACATSTGGIAGKLKGCVSDTALVGCGGYANDKGAAAATGHVEKLIKLNFTRKVVIDMEAGSAQEAVQDAVDVLKIGKLDGRAGGIAIDRHGNIGKAFENDLMPWVSIKNDEMKFGLERMKKETILLKLLKTMALYSL